jgi:hypothetical protein
LLNQGIPLGKKLSQFFFFLFGPGRFNYDKIFERGTTRLWESPEGPGKLQFSQENLRLREEFVQKLNYRTLYQRDQSRVVTLLKPVMALSKGKMQRVCFRWSNAD